MRQFPPDCQPVLDVIASYQSGTLDPVRDKELIRSATHAVRKYKDDPRLCSRIQPTHLEPGMPVCFLYTRPDCNEHFRFGIVNPDVDHYFRGGAWSVFTLNLKRKRLKRGDQRTVACGPEFRSYTEADIDPDSMRWVAAPAIPPAAPREAEQLAKLGEAVTDLFHKLRRGDL